MDCSKSNCVLPESFALRENDVLCGRGITCFEHTGNIRFRNIVSSYVPAYIKVTNKKEKTAILDTVAIEVRAGGGEFLKYDTAMERYYEVGHLFAVSFMLDTKSGFPIFQISHLSLILMYFFQSNSAIKYLKHFVM